MRGLQFKSHNVVLACSLSRSVPQRQVCRSHTPSSSFLDFEGERATETESATTTLHVPVIHLRRRRSQRRRRQPRHIISVCQPHGAKRTCPALPLSWQCCAPSNANMESVLASAAAFRLPSRSAVQPGRRPAARSSRSFVVDFDDGGEAIVPPPPRSEFGCRRPGGPGCRPARARSRIYVEGGWMIVVVAVRFVNEKRARNEQRKERRERERMRTPAGGRTAAGLPGCGPRGQGRRPSVRWRERERESSRDAELVRVPLLIILIARSKVARGDGGDRGREGEANESRGTDSAANGGSGVARGATIQRYSVKYRTENQDRRTRRELAPRRPRGRERRGAGESAPTAIVDDKEPLPPSSPRAAAARPNARPPAPPLSPSFARRAEGREERQSGRCEEGDVRSPVVRAPLRGAAQRRDARRIAASRFVSTEEVL